MIPLPVVWPTATRIIASRFPPIDLFERISSDPQDWEAFIAIESLVNPRLRQEIGEISLVPPGERVNGPGATYVMAPFTHVNPKGSRFSDGTYGVYYAGREINTALRETVHHFERFYADADLGVIRSEQMRVLVGAIDAQFLDVTSLPADQLSAVLDADDYTASRKLAAGVRAEGANGLVYPSVRDPGGECVGAFKPLSAGIPVQTKHLEYHWNGQRIDKFFDYEVQDWGSL